MLVEVLDWATLFLCDEYAIMEWPVDEGRDEV